MASFKDPRGKMANEWQLPEATDSGFFGGDEPQPVIRGRGKTGPKARWIDRAIRRPQRIPHPDDQLMGTDCETCQGHGHIMTGSGGQSKECPDCQSTGLKDFGREAPDPEIDEAAGDNFDEWFQAVYDYADANMNIGGRTLSSPAFERAARQAFQKGEDPYTFMSDFLSSRAEYQFGGMHEEEGFFESVFSSRSSPTLNRAARQTPGGSAAMDQPNLDDFDDRGPPSERDEWEELSGMADWELSPQGIARRDALMKKFDPRLGEGHGENAAKKGHFDQDPDTVRNKRSRKEPAPDFGGEPGESMFFGDKQGDDFVGTMLDPETPDQEFRGGHVRDFDQDDTEDVGDDMLGHDVSDEDIDSIWGPEGQQEPPGSDVSFPEYDYDDPDVPREPQTWFDKQYGRPGARKKLEPGKDIRTTPDRKGLGDDDKYTGDRFINFMDKGWRKAMGYKD